MKLKWCSRVLFYAPIYYTIATSEKAFRAEMKRMNVDADFDSVSIGKDATTHFMKNNKGESVAIVCLYDHTRGLSETLALITHEAVHIWQEIKLILGEKEPSVEFEAYSVQGLVQSLTSEYFRQTKRKNK